ncbi:MAG: MMPL family transporter [Treponemataceae bacterium]|nr:MMPL family transporter [Treponemataceae bacterium]
MKLKNFLLRTKILLPAWIIFHAVILIAFGIRALAGGGLNIDADLFNMLPTSTLGPAMGEADQRLTDSTARNVFVLVGHDDFKSAKQCAEQVYSKLKDDDNFSNLSLYANSSSILELEEFAHEYRFALLTDSKIEQLSTEGGAEQFSQAALSKAYGTFTLTSLSYLEEDPFLLDETNVQNYLLAIQDAGTAMMPKDGVLASQHEGTWYVMIRGTLSAKGAAIGSKTNGIAAIYDACNLLEKDGIRFVYSGTAFHSHKSSNSALKEITLISSITLSFVILMLILVFKNPVPLLASIASILVSVVTAFAATHFCYGKIHVLTLVLGTSLIGSCIDYSLHYFINWKAHNQLKTPSEIRSHLFKGLFLSLLSTEICYILLVFSPFGLLKQMGVFSFVGILSSFLSVTCIYPLFPVPKEQNRKLNLKKYNPNFLQNKKNLGLYITLGIILVLGIILGVNYKKIRIHNDMYKLYTMEGRLKDDNELSATITGYAPKGWFIVYGNSEEELLQHEESIRAELDKIQKRGYLATSNFIPSLAHQEKSVKAAANLNAFAQNQFDMLGFDQADYELYKKSFEKDKEARLLPSDDLPQNIKSVTDMLWLGKIEDQYYSIILPVVCVDEKAYTKIAEDSGFAYYENKMADLGKGLDKLTLHVIIFFVIAYVIILLMLKRFYTWRQVGKIASIPLISVMLILSVFILVGKNIEFFGLTGIILVFGLGLDYVIYMIENRRRNENLENNEVAKLEPFAIMLSFLTTAISFGALAFSTFVPVHTMGLTIFLGLVAAFFCTLF